MDVPYRRKRDIPRFMIKRYKRLAIQENRFGHYSELVGISEWAVHSMFKCSEEAWCRPQRAMELDEGIDAGDERVCSLADDELFLRLQLDI